MKREVKSLVKAIIWEVSFFILITLLTYFILKVSMSDSIRFNIIITIIKVLGLTIFDFCWERKWN